MNIKVLAIPLFAELPMNDGSECQNTRTLRGLWRAGVTARASFANIPMNIGRFANF